MNKFKTFEKQRRCIWCRQNIPKSSNICSHCGKAQNLIGVLWRTALFYVLTVVASIGAPIVTYIQLLETREETATASMLLEKVEIVETATEKNLLQLAGINNQIVQSKLTLDNLLRVTAAAENKLFEMDSKIFFSELKEEYAEFLKTLEEASLIAEKYHSDMFCVPNVEDSYFDSIMQNQNKSNQLENSVENAPILSRFERCEELARQYGRLFDSARTTLYLLKRQFNFADNIQTLDESLYLKAIETPNRFDFLSVISFRFCGEFESQPITMFASQKYHFSSMWEYMSWMERTCDGYLSDGDFLGWIFNNLLRYKETINQQKSKTNSSLGLATLEIHFQYVLEVAREYYQNNWIELEQDTLACLSRYIVFSPKEDFKKLAEVVNENRDCSAFNIPYPFEINIGEFYPLRDSYGYAGIKLIVNKSLTFKLNEPFITFKIKSFPNVSALDSAGYERISTIGTENDIDDLDIWYELFLRLERYVKAANTHFLELCGSGDLLAESKDREFCSEAIDSEWLKSFKP